MSCVGFDSQRVERREELFALTSEEPISGKAGDGSDSPAKLIAQRTNDRNMRELGTDEFTWNGKNQAGLNQAGRLEWWVGEEIRERKARIRNWRYRGLDTIARKVDPFQEVCDFISADAERDLHHFSMLRLLIHGCV